MKHYETKVRKLFWPIFFMVIINMTLSIVDQLMIAGFDANGISAIAMGGASRMISYAIMPIFAAGSGIFMYQFYGAGKIKEANEVNTANIYLTIVMSIIVFLISLIFIDQILGLYNTPDDIYKDARIYMYITNFSFLVNGIDAASHTYIGMKGKVKAFLIGSVLAHIVNIGLNYILIYGNFGFPEMGVQGSAIATLCSVFVADIFFVYFAFIKLKMRIVKLRFKKFLLISKMVFVKGFPSLMSNLINNLVIAYIVSIIAIMGSEFILARSYTIMIITFVTAIYHSFSRSISMINGYFIGDKMYRDFRLNVIKYSIISPLVTLVLMVATYFSLSLILQIFNANNDIIEISKQIVLISIFIESIRASSILISSSLAAAGDTFYILKTSPVIQIIVILIILPIVISNYDIGIVGIYLFILVSDLMIFIFNIVRFSGVKWVKKSLKDARDFRNRREIADSQIS